MTNRQDSAQALALQALGWLAADADRMGAFVAAAGLDPAQVRARAAEPLFLAAVMDFLLADEALLLAFCHEAGVPPAQILPARAHLPGGDAPFWT